MSTPDTTVLIIINKNAALRKMSLNSLRIKKLLILVH